MHQCIICLGSNYEAEKNINTALDRLEYEFDIIEWGEAIYTPAEGTAKESTYLNRGAKLYTDKSAEEIKWLVIRMYGYPWVNRMRSGRNVFMI